MQPGPVTQLLPPALGFPQPRLRGLKKEAIVLTSWPHPTPSPEPRPPSQRAGEEGAAGLRCPGVPGGDKEHHEAVALVGETSGGESPPPGSGLGDRGPLLWTRLCKTSMVELLACQLPPSTLLTRCAPGSTQALGWLFPTEKLRPREGCLVRPFLPWPACSPLLCGLPHPHSQPPPPGLEPRGPCDSQ